MKEDKSALNDIIKLRHIDVVKMLLYPQFFVAK